MAPVAMKMKVEDDHVPSRNFKDALIKIIRVVVDVYIKDEVGQQVESMPEVM